MRMFWFAVALLLVLGILTGIYDGPSITGRTVMQLPPFWDYPADFFSVDDFFMLDLDKAFFDPDSDLLSYSVRATEGVAVGLKGSVLIVEASRAGDVYVTASDGTFSVVKKLSFV